MHTQGDAKTKNGQISVTPNTITYSAPKDSQEGQGLAKKFGLSFIPNIVVRDL